MSQTDQIQHTTSIDSQDPNQKDKKKKDKSRRPANSAFRQQRLKAWQPILTPKTVLPLFFVVGIIFAPIGGLLLWASTEVQELSIDYSRCIIDSPRIDGNGTGGLQDIPSSKISKSFKKGTFTGSRTAQWGHYNDTVTYKKQDVFRNIRIPDTNICRLEFDIEHELAAPVFVYYRMTNFYQNHRRYVKSYDMNQLSGDKTNVKGGDCAPLDVTIVNGTEKPYYPCGLIANSIFNDTIQNPFLLNTQNGDNASEYAMTNSGIAWNSDKDLYKQTQYKYDEVVPPPNWRKKFPQYTADNPPPNINDWEELMVWMRTAGLPTFSKLALRNDNQNMQPGRYQIDIWDEFNVTLYSGTKELLISTRTVMGGKNPFLGIAYLVVGGLCILIGALFTVTHVFRPRKLGDHTYLTWNNEPTTATATGRSLGPSNASHT